MDMLPDPPTALPHVLAPSEAENGENLSSAFSSGARLYTLVLATIAGAGIALAVVLIFCVVKSQLEYRRQRRRSEAFTGLMLNHSQNSRQRRWEMARYRSSVQFSEPNNPARATLGPVLPWEDMASIITEVQAGGQPLTASSSMPVAPVLAMGLPRREDDNSEKTEQAEDQAELSSVSARSMSSNSLDTELAAAEGPAVANSDVAHSEHLNRHLEKLLQHLGGESVLMEVTSLDAMQRNLRPLIGMDFLDVEGLALRSQRLHIAAVAAGGLRMAALAEVGGTPGLAGLPAPWSSQYLDLMMELSKRDGPQRPHCAADMPSSSRDLGPVSGAAAQASSSSGWDPNSEKTPAEEVTEEQEDVWFEAQEGGDSGAVFDPIVANHSCAQPDHVAIIVEADKETGEQDGIGGQPSSVAVAECEPSSSSGAFGEAVRGHRSWFKGLVGRATTASSARLEAQGGCMACLTMGDIVRSSDSQPQRTYLQGGSHIGFAQNGMLGGERLRIYRFKPSVQRQLMRLCTLLEANQHPAVCGPSALCIEPTHEAAIMPAPDANTLEDVLAGSADKGLGRLPWRARLAIAYDLLMGLHHLHNKWGDALVHGSIHPSNVLISRGFHAGLSEPGFLPASLVFADQTTHEAGPKQLRGPTALIPGLMPLIVDFAYLDPQYHKRGQFTPPADVYALGVVLLKLLTGLPAKGIVTVVREAYRQEMLEDVLDPQAGDWPPAVAQGLVEVALACSERRHTRRSKLEPDVIYQIQGLLLDSFRIVLCESGIMQEGQATGLSLHDDDDEEEEDENDTAR